MPSDVKLADRQAELMAQTRELVEDCFAGCAPEGPGHGRLVPLFSRHAALDRIASRGVPERLSRQA